METSKETKLNPPRLTIRITPEQRKLLSDLIPWGMQDAVFRAIIDDLISLLLKASRAGQIKMLASALISRSVLITEVGTNMIAIKKDAELKEESK